MWKPPKWTHKSYRSRIQNVYSGRSKWKFRDWIGFSSLTTSPPTVSSAYRIPLKNGSQKIVPCRKGSLNSCHSCPFHCFSLGRKKKVLSTILKYLMSIFDWMPIPSQASLGSMGLFHHKSFQTDLGLHVSLGKWNNKVVSVMLFFSAVFCHHLRRQSQWTAWSQIANVEDEKLGNNLTRRVCALKQKNDQKFWTIWDTMCFTTSSTMWASLENGRRDRVLRQKWMSAQKYPQLSMSLSVFEQNELFLQLYFESWKSWNAELSFSDHFWLFNSICANQQISNSN